MSSEQVVLKANELDKHGHCTLPIHDANGGSVMLRKLLVCVSDGASVSNVFTVLPVTPVAAGSSDIVCSDGAKLSAMTIAGLPPTPLRT